MVSGDTGNGEVLSQSREGQFAEARQVLDVAQVAVRAALEDYDNSFEAFASGAKAALEGATIIVSEGLAFQVRSDYPGQENWKQVVRPLPKDVEVAVTEVKISPRHYHDVPHPVPAIFAEATEVGVNSYNIYYRFWLHNAEWSFKPETPTS